jgi:kinesin family protein 5
MICTPVSDTCVKVGNFDAEFHFDKIFMPDAPQESVFEFVGKSIAADVMAGYNGTVLAYGQTGSGKTFTMMGGDDEESRGLIPRAAHHIFETILNSDPEYVFTITCSMLEIYKETLRDLLDPSDIKLSLKGDVDGVRIDGLSEDYIGDEDELLEKLAFGGANRTVAATKMNSKSSRSHELFILKVCQKLPDGMEKTGILNLVDLAGSEKINMSGVTGNKLEEAKKINLSLSMLGNVIHSLSSGASHIPYRDSKLTRILQESLGGNYKTCLVVTASPHVRNMEESLSTLKFAQRAKTIKNRAVLNVKETPEVVIARLKKQLEEAYSYIEILKKSLITRVEAPLGTDIGQGGEEEEEREKEMPVLGHPAMAEGKDEWTCPIEKEDSQASLHSFKGTPEVTKNFEMERRWEELISQHEKDLDKVRDTNKRLNSEIADLKRKLKLTKEQKINAERQMMEMAGKFKHLSDKQVYLVEDLQKDDRIQHLVKEVETLKRFLKDSQLRPNVCEAASILEFEEDFSMVAFTQISDASSESECSSRVVHAIPVEVEGVTTLTQTSELWDYPKPSDMFTLRNQILQ